jgi:hemerythrin-like metal-binding protein
MAEIEISDGLIIGHAQIDAEHRALIDILNRCMELVDASAPIGEVMAEVLNLRTALVQHISNEEDIMSTLGYGDLALEQAEHIRGLAEFERLLELHKDGKNGKILVFEISGLLFDLFIRSDMGFKAYLQEIDYRG